MLVNMFSAGIWGFVMADRRVLPDRVRWSTDSCTVLSNAVDWLVASNLLPLTSIIIEPAKVLFLNNAINHGVLTPLGIQQSAETGIVDPVPPRGQPRPRRRPAARVHVLRHRRGARLGSGRGRHPVLRRHPRGLLPVRAHEADGDPRAHRGWRDRRHDEHAPRRRAARSRGSRQHLRGARRRRPTARYFAVILSVILAAAVTFVLTGDHPAGLAQARPRGDGCDGRRVRRRDHADRGEQGQVLRRARRPARRRGHGRGAAESTAGASMTEREHQEHRVRVRRRHGFVGDGRERAAQQDQEGGHRGRHGRQQGDREPRRLRRPGHHAEPAHRPRAARSRRTRSTCRSTTS